MCLLRSWGEGERQCGGRIPYTGTFPICIPVPPQTQTLFESLCISLVPHSFHVCFILLDLHLWKWLLLPFHHTMHTPWAAEEGAV